MPVDQQPDPVALPYQGICQRDGSLHTILEQRMTVALHIAATSRVKNNTDVCNTLLFKLIDIERPGETRTGAVVDPAHRVTRLILAHSEELDACPALARRDRSGVDARAPRANAETGQPHDLRHNQDLARRRDLDPAAV